MKRDYKPSEIEPNWHEVWNKNRIYSPNLDASTLLSTKKPFGKAPFDKAQGKPFYNLMMFPYPSAEGMHVGNLYAFTGADVYGRFKRMQGFDVFEPIGLDGFGIHSENFAIKVGRHPKEQAKISEANFYRQLRAIGNGFDWSRKLETYDPKYYKWTQWIFIQLFKVGLAYRAKAKVNWCPSCKTVLADEQVLNKISVVQRLDQRSSAEKTINEITVNVCERCGTEVYKKELEQWFFRITKYANRLLANLAKLDWSEKVKIAQKQWIGRSEGARVKFAVIASPAQLGEVISDLKGIAAAPSEPRNDKPFIEVFTTRPDTLFGATFVVLAPEHPTVALLLKSKVNPRFNRGQKSKVDEVRKYVEAAKKKTEQERLVDPSTGHSTLRDEPSGSDSKSSGQGEKTGVFTGLYAINPGNKEKIPIWIADYVLMEYGTGAIMGVPAHDQRDYEFAKKYGLPIRIVIATPSETRGKQSQTSQEIASSPTALRNDNFKKVYEGEGIIVNSGEWNGWRVPNDIRKVIDWLENKGIGSREITYHLRDWLISRQRYWGPPIPMIYCEKCAREGRSWFNQSRHSGKRSASRISNGNKRFWTSQNDDWNAAGWFPVPEKDLPVLLPDVKDWKPTGTGKSPLASIESFVNTKCPNCKSLAKRETDVSDNFLDSSWYFLRYLATEFDNVPFPSKAFISEHSRVQKTQNTQYIRGSERSEIQKFRQPDSSDSLASRSSEFSEYSEVSKRGDKWLPVSMYIGGAEHSVLHLLYSRFITMVLHDLGFISFEEPFSRFFAHGLLIKEKAKMSKSRGNVVVPDEYIRKFGADTLRMYLMFLGPFNQGGDFYDTALEGMYRFLKRVWKLFLEHSENSEDQKTQSKGGRKTDDGEQIADNTEDGNLSNQSSVLRDPSSVFSPLSSEHMMHKTIKKVTDDIEALRYNTAIAALMEWHNFLKSKIKNQKSKVTHEEMETFLKLLAPFAPHMTEEIWQNVILRVSEGSPSYLQQAGDSSPRLGRALNDIRNNSIHLQPWPKYDPKFLEEEEVTIVVQVDGKVRNTIVVQSSILRPIRQAQGRLRSGQDLKVKSYIEELARESEKVRKYLVRKEIKKIVYVEGKVINFVTNE